MFEFDEYSMHETRNATGTVFDATKLTTTSQKSRPGSTHLVSSNHIRCVRPMECLEPLRHLPADTIPTCTFLSLQGFKSSMGYNSDCVWKSLPMQTPILPAKSADYARSRHALTPTRNHVHAVRWNLAKRGSMQNFRLYHCYPGMIEVRSV